MEYEKIPTPDTTEELEKLLREGAIGTFSHCGAYYDVRFNGAADQFEIAPHQMNGRHNSSGERKDWRAMEREVPEPYNFQEIRKPILKKKVERNPHDLQNPLEEGWVQPKDNPELLSKITHVRLHDGRHYKPSEVNLVQVRREESKLSAVA